MTEPPAAPFPAPGGDFSAFQDGVFASVMSTVKATTSVASEDILFHRSSTPEYGALLDRCNTRLRRLTNKLLHSAGSGTTVTAPRLKDVDDVDIKWSGIVEVVDDLLEKADTCLDEYTGAVKRKNPEPLPGAAIAPQRLQHGRPAWKAAAIEKPQLHFDEKIDNLDTSPWRPLLVSKPHAVVPLEDSIYLFRNEDGKEEYAHPYQKEIESMEYPKEMFAWIEPTDPEDWDEIPPTWVDTPEALQEMIRDMRRCSEIAVDLEHHDLRSYVGITCLMQISTRDDDYIVDTIKLRGKLQPLNAVFANPKVVKVLHGAFMDAIWLQRDLGLYLVGLFDTHHAAKALGFSSGSLAFLLKKYVNFDADKKYQLADWRLRPLSKEMLDYARSDTHFLLYCFDQLRNELVENSRSLMNDVLQKSKETALQRYSRDVYDSATGTGPSGWGKLLVKTNITGAQKEVFKAVHAWRDGIAREADESPHFVLSRGGLFSLSMNMPTTFSGVLGCWAGSRISRARAGEVAQLIQKAQDSANSEAHDSVQDSTPDSANEKQATVTSETAVAPDEADKMEICTNVFEADKLPNIRTQNSGFWGQVCGSSKWDDIGEQDTVNQKIRLAIPLPELTAAVFISGNGISSHTLQKSVDPGARAEHQYVKDRGDLKKEDEIIVVKSLGGGRKRKMGSAAEDPLATDTQSSSGEGGGRIGDEGQGSAGSGSGKYKRRRKCHQSQGQGAGDASSIASAEQGVPVVEAVDYSKAPSILHSKKPGEEKGRQGGRTSGPKRAFDPYSNPEGGPKGMRKGQRERAGKSWTFKH